MLNSSHRQPFANNPFRDTNRPIYFNLQNAPNIKHQRHTKKFSTPPKKKPTPKQQNRTNLEKPAKNKLTSKMKTQIMPSIRKTTKKWRYKKENKKLQYNQTRDTTIKQKERLNTLNIASPNTDFFTTKEIQRDIIQQLTMGEIHIAPIQETHIP